MDEDKDKPEGLDFKTEMVAIKTLSNHPRNYRFHPQDQIEHLIESILPLPLMDAIILERVSLSTVSILAP